VTCNGVFMPNETTCAENLGVWCGGTFYNNVSVCPETAGVTCNGTFYANTAECPLSAGVTCNGVFYANTDVCPLSAGVTCNGTFYANTDVCPLSAGVTCNGVFYANTAECPLSAGVTCNGTFYANTDVCPLSAGVTCNGTFYTGVTTCPLVAANASGYPVTFPAGWDIVSGPAGAVVTGNIGPMYAFRPGDVSYEVVPPGTPLQAGLGYWAFFNTTTTETLPFNAGGTVTLSLPPGQFAMIGNSGTSPATVTGADVLLTFNAATNGYVQTSQLAPGQGAWAMSYSGAQVAITNQPPFTSIP
jgi:hypothetical protein